MLRTPLFRNLLILTLAIAILGPGYEYFFDHPAYQSLLIEESEDQAVRYASYMVRTLGLENQFLTKERLPDSLEKKLLPAFRDKHLIKLRIFSPQGEIIFSTLAGEIGTLNENNYFREIVAKGRVYSKVVQKDRKTAEGDVAQRDIVETYVPFKAGEAFGGAIEVYYDNTESISKLRQLSLRSLITPLVMSLGFLLAISVALYRAYISLLARGTAEDSLRLANEELEQRVTERTRELSAANEQLTGHIAERIQTQIALNQALEESRNDREKLEGILRSVPDGVVVTDGALNVLHMNAAAERVLDTSLQKVLGQSIATLSHEVDFIEKVGQHLHLVHGAQSFDLELPGAEALSPHVYQVRMSQFVFDETEAPGVVLLIRDVTRERDVERLKSAFLGMATHELNTPLTAIVGYTELLITKETASNLDAEQQKEFLRLIHNKALALADLIDDLLDISRVESGRSLTLCYQEFLLDTAIREIVARYSEEQSCHHFEMLLPDEPVRLCADRSRIVQAIEHLVSNAVKYSPGGGGVSVKLALHNDTCELLVEDEGIGMNDEQLTYIYDRFYRADFSDTAVRGVGLGMSIVRNIIQAHHGDIQIDSQPGKGTRVCVTLPMTPPADHAESHPFLS